MAATVCVVALCLVLALAVAALAWSNVLVARCNARLAERKPYDVLNPPNEQGTFPLCVAAHRPPAEVGPPVPPLETLDEDAPQEIGTRHP